MMFTTLEEKLVYLQDYYPEAYQYLCTFAPALIKTPSSPTLEDLEMYNNLIDGIYYEDEVQALAHHLA